MTLIKTSLLNGIAVLIKMLTLLGLNKILAIYVGPVGYAALGQFQNAVQMITTLASGAINTGVTKYTAEYHDNVNKQHAVWRTAGSVSLTGSLGVAFLIIIFNKPLAIFFLKDESLGSIFIWLAAALLLFVFNALLLAILNGKQEIGRFVLANIAGSVLAMLVTTLMVANFGLYGALVSLAIYQSLAFFVTLVITYKAKWFKLKYLFGSVDLQAGKKLANFTAMALTSAACVPLSHILVRNHLGERFGWEAAGYWEAMWRLSAAYLLFVTTTLGVYYLPRLSELKLYNEIKTEILQGYRIILPLAAVGALIMFWMKDVIINALFTQEFAPMRELFAWQMVGDLMKIGSWLLAYIMLAKSMMKLFIITEIIFSLSFVFFTYYFSTFMGYKAASVAHALNYSIYFAAMLLIIPSKLRKMCSI